MVVEIRFSLDNQLPIPLPSLRLIVLGVITDLFSTFTMTPFDKVMK